ncbi:E3 ubiquitin-protein ligase TRIM45-like [Amphiura filiformis]|uniref:E3 ubiquitin-protein ligase TRIM45-like n=1 Tax=Amphiura filiformis TaxID=82378 RepID=UPI003B227C01
MAGAKPVPCEDLTRCGICNEVINQPKALPCLHTFCLECLREWGKPNKETVTCPVLNCKKTTPMPSNGVDGLPGNVFVASLIDTSPSRGRNVPCVCCEETGNDVMARCLECNGFLCQEGVHLHQKKLLKSHQVIKLEDIKSGKVNMKHLADKKKATCKEHEGQQLWFYCETCGVLICRDCTVVDHSKPGHTYVTLKSTVSEQRKKIEVLVKQNGVTEKKVDKALQDAHNAQQELDSNKKKSIAEIDMEIDKIEKHVRIICQQERRRLLKQQEETVALSRKKIQSSKETLQSQKVRFQAAREVANQVLHSGSDSDVASVYKQLSNSLEELYKEEPESVPQDITELPKFKADSRITSVTIIGELIDAKHLPSKVLDGSWEMESEFGDKDGAGKVSVGKGISTTPAGDIAVANRSPSAPVKVYNSDGKFKFSLHMKSCNAWNVAVSPDGEFYVSCCRVKHIRMFGSDGRYISQFAAISPTGVASDAEGTDLRGLAINNKRQLLVGEVKKKYISIHDLNGTHITSFQVSIQPYYITTTSQGNIIVSPFGSSGVQVLDSSGTLQHTITAPTGVSGWIPTDVCSSINNEICISNYQLPYGIYCFSSTGVYLQCLTQDVINPWGITLLQNDKKMAVVNDSRVKIFRHK